jgi:hypothetical protein
VGDQKGGLDEQDDVLFETSRKLDEAGIPNMLTGSFALAFHVQEFRGQTTSAS